MSSRETAKIKEYEDTRTTALDDYETTKTREDARLETVRDDSLEDFLSDAETAVETAERPWETATRAYNEALRSYGTYDPLTGETTGKLASIEFDAEAEMRRLYEEIEFSLFDVRDPEDDLMKDYNPFAPGGALEAEGKEMGWSGLIAEGFEEGAEKGLFGETLGQSQAQVQALTTGLSGVMYDPEYEYETPFADIFAGLDKPWET